MEIRIYRQDGSLKATVSPGAGDRCVKELQGDSTLSLSFDYYLYVALDVNDYVDFCGDRFRLLEMYRPKQVSTVEWHYDLTLYGTESLIKRYLVVEHTDGDANPAFQLTAPALQHMRMIVECLRNATGDQSWAVGEVVETGNIAIDYTGKYCDEGLRELAEAAGTEYWFDGRTVNLCRCEHGDALQLEYGNGLVSLERDKADNAKFYTRLYPVGSSRNIDRTVYGHDRLQLPGGVKYVDIGVDKYGVIDHYEQDAFSGIYPRYTGTVSHVRTDTRTDDDGTVFTVFYFKDESLPFDPNDHLLPNERMRVSFQTGDMQGLGETDDHYFEADYDSSTGEFEIINIWTDGEQLPRVGLAPAVGDQYIPWNISMPDSYIRLAEQEYRAAVDNYNQKHFIDVSVYRGTTDHTWIEAVPDEDISVGRRVRLVSSQFFPGTGCRNSRIVKVTRRLDLPSMIELEVSDAVSTRTLEKLNDTLKNIAGKIRTGDNAFYDFLRNRYCTFISAIKDQVDGKAETWISSSDPSLYWNTGDLRDAHVGDMWLNSSSGTVAGVPPMATAIYTKNTTTSPATYSWVVDESIPNEVFDTIDGKAAIYTNNPADADEAKRYPRNYHTNDLWILPKGIRDHDTFTINGVDYKGGEVLTATQTSADYNASHWTKKVVYTDDTALISFINGSYADFVDDIQQQIDQKAETWYQATDPSANWSAQEKTSHVGDIWHNTSSSTVAGVESGEDAIWSGSKWVPSTVPQEVYDKIDGKKAIYVTWDSWVVNKVNTLQVRDLFIPSSDVTKNSVAYKANKVYRCKTVGAYNESGTVTTYPTFQEVAYTDDSSLTTFLNGTYTSDKANLQQQIDQKAETWYQATDPSSAWTTDALKASHVGDIWHNTSSSTVAGVESGEDAIWSGSKWVPSTVPQEVYDKIDGKKAIYVTWDSWVVNKVNTLQVRDLFIPSSDVTKNSVAYKANKVYRCKTVGAYNESGTVTTYPTFQEVAYTDDSSVNEIISKYGNILGITATADNVGEAAGYLSAILNHPSGTTVDGGLVLTSLIAMRDSGSNVWGGISGTYKSDETDNSTYKGHGIAAWFGGVMVDKEMQTAAENYARSLFRFDGSGYVASGNLSWDASGNVTLQGYSINATTLQKNGSNVATEGQLANYLPLAGGTMTGAISSCNVIPKTTHAYDLGSPTKVYEHLYTRYIDTDSGYYLRLCVAGTEVLTVKADNLSVGIGTTSPDAKLDVNGYAKTTRLYLYKPTAGSDTNAVYLEYNSSNSGVHLVGAGFYSDSFVSAFGAGSGGSGGSISLNQPLSGINSAGMDSPTAAGQAIVYNGTSWVYSTATTLKVSALSISNSLSAYTGSFGSTLSVAGSITSQAGGFVVSGKDNTYVLLAGGGTKLLSEIGGGGNTWRNVYIGGTSCVGTGTGSKAINFLGSGSVSVSYLASGTGSGQSGSSNYFTVQISASDTRYTAGQQGKTSTKLFLVGTETTGSASGTYATSYTNSNCYVGTDNSLYSRGSKVLTTSYSIVSNSVGINRSGTDFTKADNGVTSVQYPGFFVRDANGKQTGRVFTAVKTNGDLITFLCSNNYGTDGSSVGEMYIGQKIAKDGTKTWVLTDAASFRAALGLGSNATSSTAYLPLTGGTLTGSIFFKYDVDTSRVFGLLFRNTSNTNIASIFYHNTAQNIILNPVGDSAPWIDAVGKYSLFVGNNKLTYNTYAIWHSNNAISLLISKLGNETSNFTDGTEIFSSYADNDGFVGHNSNIYRRPASAMWGYIISKICYNMASGDDYETLSGYGSSRGMFVACNNGSYTSGITLTDLGAYDTLVSFGYSNRTIQFKGAAYSDTLKYRHVYTISTGNYGFSAWKTIAFTDSNVASATKLQTSRTLWGQSFDGTANVSGNMTNVGSISPSSSGSGSIGSRNNYFSSFYGGNIGIVDSTTNEDMSLVWRTVNDERVFTMYAYETKYSPIIIGQSGATGGGGIYIDAPNNCVGIGTYSPSYKLDVTGGAVGVLGTEMRWLISGTDKCINAYTGSNTVAAQIQYNGTNMIQLGNSSGVAKVMINYGAANNSTNGLQMYGYTTSMYQGRSTLAIHINSSGNVGIGTDSISSKLHVNGSITTAASNGTYIQIGGIRLVYDSSNNALKVVQSDGSTAANFYATGAVSALGANTGSGSSVSLNQPLSGINGASLGSTSTNGTAIVYYNGWKYSTASGAILKVASTVTAGSIVSTGTISCSSALSVGANITAGGSITASGSLKTGNCTISHGTYSPSTGVSANQTTISTTDDYLYITAGSYINSNKSITTRSDMRLKNIARYVDMDVEQVALAPIFEYSWKDSSDSVLFVGSSAQCWQKILPSSVMQAPDGYLSFDYPAAALAAAVITARKVVDHERRISELEKENKELKEKINRLTAA